MKKVRSIKAKVTVKPIFEKGDIFIQFFNNPYVFYPKTGDAKSRVGLDIRTMDNYGGFDKYFEDLELKDIGDTPYFK